MFLCIKNIYFFKSKSIEKNMKEKIINILKNKEIVSTEEISKILQEDYKKTEFILESLAVNELIKKQDIGGRKFWVLNKKKESNQLKIWELMKKKGII